MAVVKDAGVVEESTEVAARNKLLILVNIGK